MLLLRKLVVVLVPLLFVVSTTVAQDSLGAVHNWSVKSKKLSDGNYALQFTGTPEAGWQLYAPNQVFLEEKTVKLNYDDSSVVQQGDFVINGNVQSVKSTIAENTTVGLQEGAIDWTATIAIKGTVPAKLRGKLFYSYGKNDEFYTFEAPYEVSLEGGVEAINETKIASIDIDNPVNNCGDDGAKGKSLWAIFLLGILGGFIALLTPCVFPMIPVTVTFFTKKSQDKRKGVRNAILYGVFIFLIYTIITVPFHFVSGAKGEVFNNISTNIWLNLVFFVIFLVFALSFFGLFELTLPSSVANKADSKSGLGNIAGIFFMAATLTIVSFSCTGPILGTLLAGVSGGGAWPLTVGAAGFGLALSLPFGLFALFPHWLQSLPRSGGWMTNVKVILGFVEIALAVKFLANADNVAQWGIIKREIFVGLWLLVAGLATLYLAGVFGGFKKINWRKPPLIRLVFLVAFGLFTIYLVPGLFNTKYARLRLLSGFPPPLSYSIYPEHVLHKGGVKPLVNDLEAALARAKAENKPLLIDFTGWACVNCRRMEEMVWPDAEVDSLMRKEYVVVSLYVDEKRKLPLKDRYVYTDSTGEQNIVTVGHKWTVFQKANFKAVSQPQYAIISPDRVALTKTKFYTPNPGEFAEWLKCGLDAYRKKNGSGK